MRESRKFCQRGSILDKFLVDPNIIISGSSSARQRNALRWRVDDGPTLNAGLVAL